MDLAHNQDPVMLMQMGLFLEIRRALENEEMSSGVDLLECWGQGPARAGEGAGLGAPRPVA